MDVYILSALTTMAITFAYRIGLNKGINTPFAFTDLETGVSFSSGNSHQETCNKIEMIIAEKNQFEKRLSDSTEIIQRLEWAIFWMCDSLHNTGCNYLFPNQDELSSDELKEFKQQVANANSMLANSRSFFTARILGDDTKYSALIDFIAGRPSKDCVLQNNVSFETGKDFGEKLSALRDICLKNESEEFAFYQLKEPKIIKVADIDDIGMMENK